jgi:hypothetical protein
MLRLVLFRYVPRDQTPNSSVQSAALLNGSGLLCQTATVIEGLSAFVVAEIIVVEELYVCLRIEFNFDHIVVIEIELVMEEIHAL